MGNEFKFTIQDGKTNIDFIQYPLSALDWADLFETVLGILADIDSAELNITEMIQHIGETGSTDSIKLFSTVIKNISKMDKKTKHKLYEDILQNLFLDEEAKSAVTLNYLDKTLNNPLTVYKILGKCLEGHATPLLASDLGKISGSEIMEDKKTIKL